MNKINASRRSGSEITSAGASEVSGGFGYKDFKRATDLSSDETIASRISKLDTWRVTGGGELICIMDPEQYSA